MTRNGFCEPIGAKQYQAGETEKVLGNSSCERHSVPGGDFHKEIIHTSRVREKEELISRNFTLISLILSRRLQQDGHDARTHIYMYNYELCR